MTCPDIDAHFDRLDLEASNRVADAACAMVERQYALIERLRGALQTQLDSCGMSGCGACNKAKKALTDIGGD